MLSSKDFLILIPARYDSSRLPGKPLLEIDGKSILKRTFDRCNEVVESNKIIVLTDDTRILKHCNENKINCELTSRNCKTGTDRIAEYAFNKNYDFYLNVQGDEPIISPLDIEKMINASVENFGQILNGYAQIVNVDDFINSSVPKLVFDNNYNLMYISRSSIPFVKNFDSGDYYKQICVYAFPRKILIKVYKNKKSKIEKKEDIEILRFLENNISVKMVKLSGESKAVDTRKDVIEVKKIISKKNFEKY